MKFFQLQIRDPDQYYSKFKIYKGKNYYLQISGLFIVNFLL